MHCSSGLGVRSARALVIASAVAALLALVLANYASAYTLKTLHAFCAEANCADGSEPSASLIRDGTGNLYGTTTYGGAGADCSTSGGCGTVFELAFDGTSYTYKVLYNFCSQTACADGANPYASLILDTNGDLYGTTYAGGSATTGVAFELVPGMTWSFEKLHDFCGTACGSQPDAGLIYAGQASGALYNGTAPLYGTTLGGGANNSGAVFRLTFVEGKTNRKETVLHSFCSMANCADGLNGGGIIADGGNLFGASSDGQGNALLYKLERTNAYQEQVLYNFDSSIFFSHIPPAPVFDGGLLGTADGGGGYYYGGVVYRFAPKTSVFTILYSFCASGQDTCPDGEGPDAGAAHDASGNVFGTTRYGGVNANCEYLNQGCGVVWRLHNHYFSVLHRFCIQKNCNDGGVPLGGVIFDASGNLFGTTSSYGPNGSGTVFELVP
jgi:hypothetical protein